MTKSGVASMLGLIALVVVSVLLLGQQGVQWLAPSGQKTAYVLVTNANGLQPGSRVLDRGIDVGQVDAVTVNAERVELRIRYDRRTTIASDASVRVQNLSGLGETYLALLPGAGGAAPLADGARVRGVTDTADSTVGALSAAVSTLMSQLDPAVVQRIVKELGASLPADTDTLNTITAGGKLAAVALMRQMPQIGSIIGSANSIIPRADPVGPYLEAIAGPLRWTGHTYSQMSPATVEIIHTGNYPSIIKDGVLELFKVIQKFEDGVGPDTKYLTALLLPSVRAIAAPLGTIDAGQLLDTALTMVRGPGGVTVHLRGPAG
jgi:phospholipid/cholesterol/gamma-HCH transport system substrate-binding protein